MIRCNGNIMVSVGTECPDDPPETPVRPETAQLCNGERIALDEICPAPPATLREIEDKANEIATTDDKFMANPGLELINAHWAYARGLSGAGVTIGAIDSGLNHLHPKFGDIGKIHRESLLSYFRGINIPVDAVVFGSTPMTPEPGFIKGYPADTRDDPGMCPQGSSEAGRGCTGRVFIQYRDDVDSTLYEYRRIPNLHTDDIEHGTRTALVMAGSRESAGPHGVAPVAQLFPLAYQFNPPDSEEPLYKPISSEDIDRAFRSEDRVLSELFDVFVEEHVPVANLSFGFPGLISRPEYNVDFLKNAFRLILPALTQESRNPASDDPTDWRTIWVHAAGNANNNLCIDAEGMDVQGMECVFRIIKGVNRRVVAADTPNILAGAPRLIPGLRGHSLAVVAVDARAGGAKIGDIAGFSNRCGSLPDDWDTATHGRHYCLAAPGVEVLTSEPLFPASGTGTGTGTSFAAPHVTGAIALLIEMSTDNGERSMSNTAIAQRILETANRQGDYAPDTHMGDADRAYSTIYGAGLLDLKAATEPVGAVRIALSSALEGPAAPLHATRLVTGTAYGDAFRRAFSGRRLAALDDLQFPFWHSLSDFAEATASAPALAGRRHEFTAPARTVSSLPRGGRLGLTWEAAAPARLSAVRKTEDRAGRPGSLSFSQVTGGVEVFASWRAADATPLGLRQNGALADISLADSDAFSHPFLALADDALVGGARLGAVTAAAFWSGGDDPAQTQGLALDYALTPRLSAQAGLVRERGRALGLRPEGAFGPLEAVHTAFTGLKFAAGLDAPAPRARWQVLGLAHVGFTQPDAAQLGMITDMSALTASAFSLGVTGRGVLADGDAFAVTLSQPLRIESGHAALTWPTGRTPGGSLLRDSARVPLAPSGREVEASASYGFALPPPWQLKVAAGVARHPGHDRTAITDLHALADLRLSFWEPSTGLGERAIHEVQE